MIGESSSQGTMSNSWIAEPVTLDSLVAPGPELTPRLMLCTSSGVPIVPGAERLLHLPRSRGRSAA